MDRFFLYSHWLYVACASASVALSVLMSCASCALRYSIYGLLDVMGLVTGPVRYFLLSP